MARGIQLNEVMMQTNFYQLAQTEADPKARVRLLALMHIQAKKSKTSVGSMLGLNRDTISDLIARVNQKGLDGIHDEKRSGRRPRLAKDQEVVFKEQFLNAQKKKSGGRLTGYDAQKMLKELGAEYKKSAVYKILDKIGLSWISSRSMHPQGSQEAQENFKKNLLRRFKRSCRKTLLLNK